MRLGCSLEVALALEGRLEILKDSPPVSAKAKVRRIRNTGAEIVRKWRRAQRVANFGNIYKQEFVMAVVISNRIYGPSRSQSRRLSVFELRGFHLECGLHTKAPSPSDRSARMSGR